MKTSPTARPSRDTSVEFLFENLEPRNMLAVDLPGIEFEDVGKAGLVFLPDELVPVGQQMELLRLHTGMTEAESFELVSVEADQIGFTHFRYRQLLDGIPVESGRYSIHSRDGNIVGLSGDYVAFATADSSNSLHERDAFISALDHVDNRLAEPETGHGLDDSVDPLTGFTENPRYMWQSGNGQLILDAVPRGELVYLQVDENSVALAYRFDIYVADPLYKSHVYVDAESGEVLREYELLHSVDTPASGQSLYNGNVNFTADSFGSGSQYRLRVNPVPAVRTYDMNNGESYAQATDVVSNDTTFNDADHPTGVQVHWGAEQTVDYFWNVHNRNSFNNNGAVLNSYFSFLVGYNNAFWDGSRLTFGDGDGTNYSPLVSVDVIGHEFTHGVVEYTASLIYSYESGALNESFADIFGEAVERYATGSNDWRMGADFFINGGAIRDFADPNSLGDPDTYLGNYWHTGSSDNGGVHTNSTVPSYWFHLLSEGGSGINDNGDSYDLTGIGIEDAARIAYRNLSVYLTPTSQFLDARVGSIQSAIDLFGAESPEHLAVEAAWDAVGVYELNLRFDPELVPSLGSLIYADTQIGEVSIPGLSVDTTIKLDAGQTVSLEATGTSLVPSLQVFDPFGNLVGDSPGTASTTILQTAPVQSSGEYTIEISGASGTTGQYTLSLMLNASFEQEDSIDVDNDSMSTAQNLDGSAVSLGNSSADRLGVIGYLGRGVTTLAGDDFESGTFGSQWTLSSSHPAGLIENWGGPGTAVGDKAMIMHVGTNLTFNLNEAILNVDLTGAVNPLLTFYAAEWVDESHYLPTTFTGSVNGDGVAISDDGVNWYSILEAVETDFGIYHFHEFDLQAIADARGLVLGADFKIKFQQYDDYLIYSDGIGFDEVFVQVPKQNEDWYSFTLDSGTRATISAEMINGPSDLSLDFYDSSGTLLLSGNTFGSQVAIEEFTNTGSSDTFYVHMTGTTEDYSLVVTRNAAFNVEHINSVTIQDITGLQGVLGSVFRYRTVGADPDDFKNGTILDTRFPGITFSNDVTNGSVWAAATHDIFDAPTGLNVFAPEFAASDGWREFDNELRADFDELQDYVSIDVGSDDAEDIGWLRAYDSNGVLLQEVVSGPVQLGQSQTISIDRPGRDIAYVVAAGIDFHITPMDNLQYTDYVVDDDVYGVNATVGEVLDFQAWLPGEGPFQFINLLDQPTGSMLGLELYDPLGNLIAADSSVISHVANQNGNYKLKVLAHDGQGEYYVSRQLAGSNLKFDFGPVGQNVAADFTGVGDADYDAAAGYGWTQKIAFAPQDNSRGNALTGDGVRAANARFAVDVENATYEVVVHMGFALHLDSVRINVEGADYVFQPQANMVQTFNTDVIDGQLNLQFHGEFGQDSLIRVSGLEINQVLSLTGPVNETGGEDLVLSDLAEMVLPRDQPDQLMPGPPLLDIVFAETHDPGEPTLNLATSLIIDRNLARFAGVADRIDSEVNPVEDRATGDIDCRDDPGCTCASCIELTVAGF